MNRWKEIAKFACGAEAFHAFVHAYLWFSGTNLMLFGFTQTLTWNLMSAIVNAEISLGLGLYAWRATSHKQAR